MTVADRRGGFHRVPAVETEQRLQALRFGQNVPRHLRDVDAKRLGVDRMEPDEPRAGGGPSAKLEDKLVGDVANAVQDLGGA